MDTGVQRSIYRPLHHASSDIQFGKHRTHRANACPVLWGSCSSLRKSEAVVRTFSAAAHDLLSPVTIKERALAALPTALF